MSVKRLLLGLFALLAVAGVAQENNMVDLKFSLDNGKTWAEDFPSLPKPGLLLVKAAFASDEKRPVDNGVVTSSLFCAQQDFASANAGRERLERQDGLGSRSSTNHTLASPIPALLYINLTWEPARWACLAPATNGRAGNIFPPLCLHARRSPPAPTSSRLNSPTG